jgi:hypothetical protein
MKQVIKSNESSERSLDDHSLLLIVQSRVGVLRSRSVLKKYSGTENLTPLVNTKTCNPYPCLMYLCKKFETNN